MARMLYPDCHYLTETESDDKLEYVNFGERLIPWNIYLIRSETRKDSLLIKLINYVNCGWPNEVIGEIKPYFIRKNELSLENGVLMWGYRIVIPIKLRQNFLQEVHSCHTGISKMKSITRSYFWWPKLDCDIENFVKNCHICMLSRPELPISVTTKWPESTEVFDRIHLDFLGPIENLL